MRLGLNTPYKIRRRLRGLIPPYKLRVRRGLLIKVQKNRTLEVGKKVGLLKWRGNGKGRVLT